MSNSPMPFVSHASVSGKIDGLFATAVSVTLAIPTQSRLQRGDDGLRERREEVAVFHRSGI
jgi:hypothetical protein